MEYLNLYKKRLNRYGTDYQERIQTERERLFLLYLQKTVYWVEFEYKQACAQIVDKGFERKAETALKIIGGILIALTAGCAAYSSAKGIPSSTRQLHIEPRTRR